MSGSDIQQTSGLLISCNIDLGGMLCNAKKKSAFFEVLYVLYVGCEIEK